MSTQIELGKAFDAPALDSQAVFRSLLEAWARPGRLEELDRDCTAPEVLSPASAQLALTLLDHDTLVWLSPALIPAANWITFHTGCPVTTLPDKASFVFATAKDLPALTCFNIGDAMSPELGATVIVQIEALTGGTVLTLDGPGIDGTVHLAPQGLSPAFWEERATLASSFPAGLDLILVTDQALACLPRTTRITQGA